MLHLLMNAATARNAELKDQFDFKSRFSPEFFHNTSVHVPNILTTSGSQKFMMSSTKDRHCLKVCRLRTSYRRITASALGRYCSFIFLNLSCPAVSQIFSVTTQGRPIKDVPLIKSSPYLVPCHPILQLLQH